MKAADSIGTYTVREVALILQVTPQSVLHFFASGRLKGDRVGIKYYIPHEALLEFLEDCPRSQPPEHVSDAGSPGSLAEGGLYPPPSLCTPSGIPPAPLGVG